VRHEKQRACIALGRLERAVKLGKRQDVEILLERTGNQRKLRRIMVVCLNLWVVQLFLHAVEEHGRGAPERTQQRGGQQAAGVAYCLSDSDTHLTDDLKQVPMLLIRTLRI